jgi:glycosyltransferase, family 2
MNKKLISIVLPAYKEEKNISIIYEELLKVLEKIKNNFDYEIIFIND